MVTPGFPPDLNEIGALLRVYSAWSFNSIPTFRVNLSVPFSRVNVSMELSLYTAKSQKCANLTSKRIKETIPSIIQVRFVAGKTAKRVLFICGNKMPTRCNRGFYFRSYCLLNMFRAPLCPSSGAQEYYTVVAACGILCCGFQVVGLVWS